MNLETWAGPNRPCHKQNLEVELELKNQSATELAQQNKELLTAEWAAQVSDREAQQSHHARAPTRGRVSRENQRARSRSCAEMTEVERSGFRLEIQELGPRRSRGR